MERARLLPALVELAVAAEQMETARDAAVELDALATLYGSDALTATACWARGLVALADGDPAAAVAPLREAVRRWHALEAPYEAARARTLLAEAYQATNEDESAAVELEAAHAIFERLGAVAGARRAAELLRRERAEAVSGTFVFSDICGSTNLVEAIGDTAWLDLVEWHDRTLRALFREHRGDEVDHAGDGFFVAFQDPAAALACAVAIQRALAEHRRNHGFAPPVRIGVHTADAIPAGAASVAREFTLPRVSEPSRQRRGPCQSRDGRRGRAPLQQPTTLELKGLSDPIELVTIDWEYR